MAKMKELCVVLALIAAVYSAEERSSARPNIIMIMTDDMGWNDVGFHGSNEIPTPNIDAMAYSGVILNRHYVLPTCTPSRASFLTGRHAGRMGLQGIPPNVAEPRGIPLSERLLPEYLKELGYDTRLVGKWHLGYYTDKHLPTSRGFDSFDGIYGGYVKYFTHVATKHKHTGIDLHSDVPGKHTGLNTSQYITDFITERAENIIRSHDKQKPLFLQISHVAGHASENVDQIEPRDMKEVDKHLGYIPNIDRRKYAGVVKAVDESVGKVIKALGDADLLANSIVIFTSDNGGSTAVQPFANTGSNYPFRGLKGTGFEGGVRVPAWVFSPLLNNRNKVVEEYVHITDWFPTLYKLAGGDLDKIKNLDGIDQWAVLNGEKTKRDSILLNCDEVLGPESAIMGKYKLVQGQTPFYDDFFGKSAAEYSPETYDVLGVSSSTAGRTVTNMPNYEFPRDETMLELRAKATVRCDLSKIKSGELKKCQNACLFDIQKDPCETNDIAQQNPEIARSIRKFMDSQRSQFVNQTNTYIDPAGYPEHFGGYWMPWMTSEYTPPANRNKTEIWGPTVFCEGYPMGHPKNCL